MSFLSLESCLLDQPMQRRFSLRRVDAGNPALIAERIPKTIAYYERAPNLAKTQMASIPAELPTRVYTTADTRIPEVQLLSNGSYHVMATNAGGGYSHWKNLAITRWKPDTTQDNWGTFFYLRDLDDGDFWSTAYQPVKKESARYETIFSEGRAEYRCIENGIETHCEVVVSPEDDIELRRHKITNRFGKKPYHRADQLFGNGHRHRDCRPVPSSFFQTVRPDGNRAGIQRDHQHASSAFRNGKTAFFFCHDGHS